MEANFPYFWYTAKPYHHNNIHQIAFVLRLRAITKWCVILAGHYNSQYTKKHNDIKCLFK